jgi:phosphatidylserine decarboxylase
MSASTLGERVFLGLQYLLPQHALSRLVGAIARSRIGFVRTALIRAFLSRYAVDLSEAAHAAPQAYRSFNDFFTRPLRAGARPLDPEPRAALCPVDGTVSQSGRIERGSLLQAKGMEYSAAELLGGDAGLAGEFAGGAFATLYLAPHNYHRVHMPLAGTLRRARSVPGELFSVNDVAAASVPRLFVRNERVVCVFDTTAGCMAVVLVGAFFVGSISLAWTGEVRAAKRRAATELPVTDPIIALDRGALLGWFNMGSTVIVMFAAAGPALVDGLAPGRAVRMGERLALAR